MSKRKTYFDIHKNKSPKKLKYKSSKKIDFISLVSKVVKNAFERIQMQIEKSQPIPKYELGGNKNKLALVGENKNEVIVDKNGNLHELQAVKKQFNTAEDLVKASKHLKNLAPTLEEAGLAFKSLSKAFHEAEEKGILKTIS